jgi:AraC-like DNA-binding protein
MGRSSFLDNSLKLLIPSFTFSVLLFIIGYLGNRQDQIVKQIVKLNELYPEREATENEPNDVVVKLEEYFTSQKAFLNKDLKIWEVSKMLNSNRTYVSGIINKHYGMNFCSYVNHYRVEEARRMLKAESFDGYTLDHIGDLSGFGSLNSFIRAFQKETGITPGKYREDRKIRTGDQPYARIKS